MKRVTIIALSLIASLAYCQPQRAFVDALFGQQESASWPPYLSGGVAASNCVAVYVAKGAASYAASKVNIANPGVNNLGDGTAYPTWNSATGWVFVAALSQYLNNGPTPTVNPQSWTMIVKFAGGSGTTTRVLAGYDTATARFALYASTASGAAYNHGGSTGTLIVSPNATSGVLAFAGRNAYRDGASDGTINSSVGGAAGAMYVGCRNNAGTAANFFNGSIEWVAIYNATLTQAQIQAIGAAMP